MTNETFPSLCVAPILSNASERMGNKNPNLLLCKAHGRGVSTLYLLPNLALDVKYLMKQFPYLWLATLATFRGA